MDPSYSSSGNFFSKTLSGTLLISGTTVGAGMLGIPLMTGGAGFFPGITVTFFVWLLMLVTGLMLLEATLWMPDGSNLLTISENIFGSKARKYIGVLFVFLYYSLMIAYFAAGGGLFQIAIQKAFSWQISYHMTLFIFGLIFGSIVAIGPRAIDRMNILLAVGLLLSYLVLIGSGGREIEINFLKHVRWSKALFAPPVLFSAFGYHNVIPSLSTYLHRDRKSLYLAVFFGTLIPFLVYVIWQWLIMGILPVSILLKAEASGVPITTTLAQFVKNPWIITMGSVFGFFAIVTSFLGVSFSMVDFLADGLKVSRTGGMRLLLCLLTFVPPFLFAIVSPGVFDTALGVAGGFGEALLNGIIPLLFIWVGVSMQKRRIQMHWVSNKMLLSFVGILCLAVIIIESFALLYSH